MEDSVILNVNGKAISNNDIIIFLKENASYKNSLQDLIKLRALQYYGEKNNITIADEELQEFVNIKRKSLGLLSSQATQSYLSSLGLSTEQWIDCLENEFLKSKIMDNIISDDTIEKYFNENKLQFVEVELYKIVCEDCDKAEELLMEVRDDKKDFFELARLYSIDADTQPASGYAGRIKRGVLPINIEQIVFASEENTLFGPVKTSDKYSIYLVGKIIMPELTDERKKVLKSALFELWQNQLVQSLRIELPNN